MLGRIVEQRERRQLARIRRLEQRNLPLLLSPLAGLERLQGRLDAWFLSLGLEFLLDLHDVLARGRLAAPFRAVAKLTEPDQRLFIPRQAPVADLVHDGNPRKAEEQRDGRYPNAEQECACAEQFHDTGQPAADRLPDDASSGMDRTNRREVQRR